MAIKTLSELTAELGSRYALVVATSKRARQLIDNPELMEGKKGKAVSIAMDELRHGKIELTNLPNGRNND